MKKALIILFSLLYLAVGFVSTYHAISFFEISNTGWLAVILAIAFEIGQAAVLFSLLTSKSKRTMPWILMGVLTLVQVLGNVYSSYSYMILNHPDEVKYFIDSVLFYLQDPDPKVNQVMISYITGAILPIVSLCMTSMVIDAAELNKEPENSIEDFTEESAENEEEIIEESVEDFTEESTEKNEEKESKIIF